MGVMLRRLSAKPVFFISVVILCSLSLAQSGPVSSDPSAQERSAKSQDGFVDFTLKHINPSETDYGRYLSEGRRMLVEETIRNAYFWSNLVSLAALAYLFFIVFYQHRIQAKREVAVGEMVEQFEQILARSRVKIAEATKKNRELADALAVLKEPSPRSASLLLESSDGAALATTTKTRTTNIQAAPPPPAKSSANAQVGGAAHRAIAKEHTDQMRLFTPDPDFVMKLNSLEQQLAQSREDNRRLRRRIGEGDRKLETEEGRNRQLKGA